jgi:hypothetical protein
MVEKSTLGLFMVPVVSKHSYLPRTTWNAVASNDSEKTYSLEYMNVNVVCHFYKKDLHNFLNISASGLFC